MARRCLQFFSTSPIVSGQLVPGPLVLRLLVAGLLVPGLLVLALPGVAQAQPVAPSPSGGLVELRPNDRIVFVGNTLAERQQYFNHFETQLMTRFPDLQLSLRNLGWSADTITLQPRPLNFGDATKHLTEQKADVIVAFFGLNESFDGEAGLPKFEADLEAYLKNHLAARYNGRSAPRLVLVSPLAHERLAHLAHVDVETRNRELARYTDAMRRIAAKTQVPFVDLYTPTKRLMEAAPAPLTINGIHVNETGDRIVAALLMSGLGFTTPDLREAQGTQQKELDSLRETVREKNERFFYRWRPVNAEYVVGRRVDPFGSVNFPPEMKDLDRRVSDLDHTIWKRARSLKGWRYGTEPAGPSSASNAAAFRPRD